MGILQRSFARAALLAIGLCAAGLCTASLQAGFIVDNTIGTATRNGSITPGEYVGGFAGVNSGFGNVIGSNSTLFVDSSLTGNLNFGFQRGSGAFNDVIVLYIDSQAGGFSTTANFTDRGDPGRRAISGFSFGGPRSTINFAPGFTADYAISIESGFAGLFQLAANQPHTFISSANLINSGTVSELELTLSQLGMTQGGSFRYLATYLNQDNSFRSNEFNGVSFSGSNPGNGSTINLGANDFHTFQSVPEPSALSLLGLTALAAVTGYRRRVR